jgi:eight-cysteine-cluster-containing protein
MRFGFKTALIGALLTASLVACACNGNRQPQSPAVEASATKSTTDSTQGYTAEGCARTGCSGNLCAPAGETVISTCVWKEEYACYKSARCEKQSDGKCGWTPSTSLSGCLDAARSSK